MSDDDKTKKGPGVFDPEDLVSLLGKSTETNSLELSEVEEVKSHSDSGKEELESGKNEQLLKEFYWALLKKYENRKFFNDDFSSHDLSNVLDLLYKSLSKKDRQNFLNYLAEDMEKVKGKNQKKVFSPIRFLETNLYGYGVFEKSLKENDLDSSDLKGEAKLRYEELLLSLGKFLSRQYKFIQDTEIPSYKEPRHKKALKSLDYVWRSLYWNDDERLPKAIPNELLRKFWFEIDKEFVKAERLFDGQKREFAYSLDILGGDWRRLAKFTVDWQLSQLHKLLQNILEKNEYLQSHSDDLELVKQLAEQIMTEAKFEAKESLDVKNELKKADEYLNKWFKDKHGKLLRLYQSLRWFVGECNTVDQELLTKKITPEKANARFLRAKEDLLLGLVKMEADLLRAVEIKKPQTRDESVLVKGLTEPSGEENPVIQAQEKPVEPPFVGPDYLDVPEESIDSLIRPDEKAEPKPPFQPSEALSRFMKEESLSAQELVPEEEVKIEKKEDYQVTVDEYNFLKNILSDKNLASELSGEIFEKLKDLPKTVYKKDLPKFDKVKFDAAWKKSAEILNQKINQLMEGEVALGEDSFIRKYLPSLEAQLGVQGMSSGYDSVYDLDGLEKRWALYQALNIALALK